MQRSQNCHDKRAVHACNATSVSPSCRFCVVRLLLAPYSALGNDVEFGMSQAAFLTVSLQPGDEAFNYRVWAEVGARASRSQAKDILAMVPKMRGFRYPSFFDTSAIE